MNETTSPEDEVSPTLGDTLSNREKEDLRDATVDTNSEPNAEQSDGKPFEQIGADALSTLKNFINEHPYQSAGIAIAGASLLYSIFSSKSDS